MRTPDEHLQAGREALEAGTPDKAVDAVRWLLDYPGDLDEARFISALELLAAVAGHFADAELETRAQAVARNPIDPKALYELGYQLVEARLFAAAATMLSRALDEMPDEPAIVAELATAFEEAGLNAKAVELLEGQPDSVEHNPFVAYLLAFNHIMMGHIDPARGLVPGILEGAEDEQASLAVRIASMIERADAVASVTSLDSHDLRGWHYVLHGSLLLHESEEGRDVMNGRYAFVQDSVELCRQGIAGLQLWLDAAGLTPERVLHAPGRDSTILAHAVSRILDLPLEPFGADTKGLVVAYDLGGLEHAALVELSEHRPNQPLFVHAACWTHTAGLVPDVCTFLHQANTAPWERQLKVVGGNATSTEPDNAPEPVVAQRIVDAQAPELADAPALRELIEAGTSAAWSRRAGRREPFFFMGPVRSARFR